MDPDQAVHFVGPDLDPNCLHKELDIYLSHDFESGSEIMPCNKIDKPRVVYKFLGNVMTFITSLRIVHNDKIIMFLRQK